MRENLTKKQISEATVLELAFRMNFLHALAKSRPQDEAVPMADIREGVEINAELRRRLKNLLPRSVALDVLFKRRSC